MLQNECGGAHYVVYMPVVGTVRGPGGCPPYISPHAYGTCRQWAAASGRYHRTLPVCLGQGQVVAEAFCSYPCTLHQNVTPHGYLPT